MINFLEDLTVQDIAVGMFAGIIGVLVVTAFFYALKAFWETWFR